jgi:hypothetical protein
MKKIYEQRAKKKIKVQTVRVKYTLALPARAESVAHRLGILNGGLESYSPTKTSSHDCALNP